MSLTIKAKLLCQETDSLHYTTYVFEITDINSINIAESKYLMCTRWPNWDHRDLQNGEEGFLSYDEIVAGKSKWFNGVEYIPYKYSNIQFNKFVRKQLDQKHEFKL